MNDCEVCIYELIGHKFGKMIHILKRLGLIMEYEASKDEPLTCDGNCWMKKQNGEWLCEYCQRKPQTEREGE